MGFGDFIGGLFEGVGNVLHSAVDALTGVVKDIGNAIEGLCQKIGGEGIMLIGLIATSILIPGIGIPELLTVIQVIAEAAKLLGANKGEDSPEELGMKAEIADKKPEDFDSISEYIDYLNEQVSLEEGASENLSPEEKAKYGSMGAALNIKAIEEKYNVGMSQEFLSDVSKMKMTSEEVSQYIKEFSENGIDNMQDMSDYLKDKNTSADRNKVADSMIKAMSELYPECSSEELEQKLVDMGAQLTE